MFEVHDNEILCLGSLPVLKRTVLLEKVLFHFRLCDIGNLNIVIRYHIIFPEFEIHFRSKGNIELEFEIVAVLPLHVLLAFCRKRLPYHFQVVFLDEAVQ